MTDNILETKTTVLGHVVCAPQESGVRLTLLLLIPCPSFLDLLCDREHWFACVSLFFEICVGTASHTWNLREQTEDTSLWTKVDDKVVLRVVSCFSMAFDPMFRCLQETTIPKNLDNLEILNPAQCAYADDLAVASSSSRELMSALGPAFRSVDSIAGLNLNYRKRCWVQYGNEEHDSLRHGSRSYEEFP